MTMPASLVHFTWSHILLLLLLPVLTTAGHLPLDKHNDVHHARYILNNRGRRLHGVHFPHEGDELRRLVAQGHVLDDMELKLDHTFDHDDTGLVDLLEHIRELCHCVSYHSIFGQDAKYGLHLWWRFVSCNTDTSGIFAHHRGQGGEQAMQQLQDALEEGQVLHLQKASPDFETTQYGEPTINYGSSNPHLRRGQQQRPQQEQPQEQQVRQDQDEFRRLAFSDFVDDPLASLQGHYDTIYAQEARALITEDKWNDASNVVVHVLDDGIDVDHEDLQGSLWNNPGEDCNATTDLDLNGFFGDCHGYNHANNNNNIDHTNTWRFSHGTHVAGTIAAQNNDVGVASIASGVSLMAGLGFGQGVNGGFELSIYYAIEEGASISQNSWGYDQEGAMGVALEEAIDAAVAAGVVVVFAAGNSNSDGMWYPGYYAPVIAVAMTHWDTDDGYPLQIVTPENSLASGGGPSGSNYGSWVDISAPGFKILSTIQNGVEPEGGNFPLGYDSWSGTSMAAPHISGVLALGKVYKPEATREELEVCLLQTRYDILEFQPPGRDEPGQVPGMAHAENFLVCLGASLAPTTSPTVSTWDNFECDDFDDSTSDWGLWIDGGEDEANIHAQIRPNAFRSHSLPNSVRLRNNDGYDSSMYTQRFDIGVPTEYARARLNFWYYARAEMDNGERFKVQVAYDSDVDVRPAEGDWVDVKEYVVGGVNSPAINTNTEETVIVEFEEGHQNVRFRIMQEADQNPEQVWIDDVCISFQGDSTQNPTTTPTTSPSVAPTTSPTPAPTVSPTISPSHNPTNAPTRFPTTSPSAEPTKSPTETPTTQSPSVSPTSAPTGQPSLSPTSNPTVSPTSSPSTPPTQSPTKSPTISPTKAPSVSPTTNPTTAAPTSNPTTASPTTGSPTGSPVIGPTTDNPTTFPTIAPTLSPTDNPTENPTASPTLNPSRSPTEVPTTNPTNSPTTSEPTVSPTNAPSVSPTTSNPTISPTRAPSSQPTVSPSKSPSVQPTRAPSDTPTSSPTDNPTHSPTTPSPTDLPTVSPTKSPTHSPTNVPTGSPTLDSGPAGFPGPWYHHPDYDHPPVESFEWDDLGIWDADGDAKHYCTYRARRRIADGYCAARLRGGKPDTTLTSEWIDVSSHHGVNMTFWFYMEGIEHDEGFRVLGNIRDNSGDLSGFQEARRFTFVDVRSAIYNKRMYWVASGVVWDVSNADEIQIQFEPMIQRYDKSKRFYIDNIEIFVRDEQHI